LVLRVFLFGGMLRRSVKKNIKLQESGNKREVG
jgi:hypothetical protein